MKTFDLSPEERSSILAGVSRELSAHAEILFAYAYGSFLDESPFRDLDLAVYVDREQACTPPFHYEDALATALTRQLELSFPVDMRVLNETPVSFRYRVIRGRLLFERDPDARIDLVVHTLARYFDSNPFLYHYLKDAHSGEA